MKNTFSPNISSFDFQRHRIALPNLDMLKKKILANQDRIVNLASKGSKTPIKYHKQDIVNALNYLDKLPNLFKDYISNNQSDNINIMPKGNILMALSANEPVTMSIVPTIFALSLGNVLYVKPASQNYNLVLLLSKIINYSLDFDRFIVVNPKKENVSRLAKSEKINQVYWFGSKNTISIIAPIFLKEVVDFVYECEGNDYIYVGKGADLEKTTSIVINSLATHNGQCCNAIKGILASKENYPPLITMVKNKLKSLTIGRNSTDLTDLSYPDSLKKTVAAYVKELIGNERCKKGISVHKINNCPLMVSGVSKDNAALRKTIFGPLVWCIKMNSPEEAIRFANNSDYGIGLTVMSGNKREIELFKKFGWYSRINVNKDPLDILPDGCWGGIRKSGVGGSKTWFDKFSNKKYISEDN